MTTIEHLADGAATGDDDGAERVGAAEQLAGGSTRQRFEQHALAPADLRGMISAVIRALRLRSPRPGGAASPRRARVGHLARGAASLRVRSTRT